MFKLKRTCGGCPESYNAYYEGKCVAYLHLRHGQFTVECNGQVIYSASPSGDGIFEYDERVNFLNEACLAILWKLDVKIKKEPIFEIIDETFQLHSGV